MFSNPELSEHLKTSPSIKTNAAVVAEINMNISGNIENIGNYRYRPSSTITSDDQYAILTNSYSANDEAYVGATEADVLIDGGFDNQNIPTAFLAKKDKERLLYSLEDCIGRFRPRSGINKLRYFSGKFTHHENIDMADRPRYYMADKNDAFKYWTSYRTENGIERGISKDNNGQFYIDDAVPFVVYKNQVPVNRIVIKMQTNIGTKQLGPFSNSFTTFPDPFFGNENATTPKQWKIQYLSENTWKDALTFDETSTRANGSPIVGSDGYVQISYGLLVPDGYEDTFNVLGEYSANEILPHGKNIGDSYLVRLTENDPGSHFIWNGAEYEVYPARYGWYLDDETLRSTTQFLKEIVNPPSYQNAVDLTLEYREFQYIRGIRVVVETMNVDDTPFDLIEMSSRLAIDLSDAVENFSINKTASDLGISGMPVGQLLAATGQLNIFDAEDAFNSNNALSSSNPGGSVIADYITRSIQFKFYEKISDVPDANGVLGIYYIPIKTMYSEGFPTADKSSRSISIELRDLFFHFESLTAPQILVQNVSVSYAVSLLLDSVGFSNYTFKRVAGETELIIPNFFIAPDRSVAEILQDIAIATQTAMFFDEDNNFVMFSRNYMMPSESDRSIDLTLYGSNDFEKQDQLENASIRSELANVVGISETTNNIFNDGVINYTNRYIQRTYSSLRQASVIDKDKSWIYKPALLWEVAGTEITKSINDDSGNQSTYMLSAIPLNSDLSADIPAVEGYELINNTIDLGEGIYWISRYNGYFYANGEIIRYDAVQYNVPGVGDVWIHTNEEYQQYFSNIPFNGKMYPTGLIRIFAEPNYEIVDGIVRLRNGSVVKHGRGQFGTMVTDHYAGLNSYWSNSDPETAPVRGLDMQSSYLFSSDTEIDYGVVHSPSFAQNVARIRLETLDDEEVSLFSLTINHEFTPGDKVSLKENGVSIGDAYVSVALLSNNQFTVANTRSDALNGLAINISASIESSYTVALVPEENATTATIEIGDKTKITTSSAHGLLRDQRIFFNTSGLLPNGMAKHQAYYVIKNDTEYPITTNSFYISDSWRGEPLKTSGSQSGIHRFTLGISDEAAKATIVVPDATKIKVGSRVSMISGPGRLSTNTRVTSIHLATKQTKGIQAIILATPGEIKSFYHGLETGDKVFFDSTGQLPVQLVRGVPYYVIKTGESTFSVSTTRSAISPIEFGGVTNGSAWFIKDIYDVDRITIDPPAEIELTRNYRDANNTPVTNNIKVTDVIDTVIGKAGWSDSNNEIARKTTRNGIIKNFLSKSSFEETDINRMYTTQSGTIQSSALVMNGPNFALKTNPLDFVSYAYRPLVDNKFTHFGTRMRIIGKINTSENTQTPLGTMPYYANVDPKSDEPINLAGSSGGIGVLVNPETNNGYFLELIALNDTNLNRYSSSGEINNIIFYKTVRSGLEGVENSTKAIPVKLWGGLSQILIDDGTFAGQYRMATEEKPTVYDIAVEYVDEGTIRKFYIYLNNQIIAVVEDDDPLPIYNNMSLFVRGSSRLMFENVYALANNYSQNTIENLTTSIADAFGKKEIRVDESFRKYAMSGIVQETYLANIDPAQPPKYNIYFEEFGTIMREAAYFNVKYDKAYPALYAQISPTFNSIKGYTISGFRAGSYGAEFLVFNNTDTALSLDETTGNYLRIQGVTFTQQSSDEYTVDDYFSELSDFSAINYEQDATIGSLVRIRKEKEDIRNSRLLHGRNQFVLDSEYIQSKDSAEGLMSWMISKIMKPRKSVGVEVFGTPILQLGDIVNLNYKDVAGVDQVAPDTTRFVVYSIAYENSTDGPAMTAYLSEVI